LAEQQNDIARALAGYGIAVRPNSPVTLVATVTHHEDAINSVTADGAIEDTDVVQGIFINVEFFVKAAALRNGRLHLVMAAPAIS
jgi:UbiD family decarboxylase